MVCSEGRWVPTRKELAAIPDCQGKLKLFEHRCYNNTIYIQLCARLSVKTVVTVFPTTYANVLRLFVAQVVNTALKFVRQKDCNSTEHTIVRETMIILGAYCHVHKESNSSFHRIQNIFAPTREVTSNRRQYRNANSVRLSMHFYHFYSSPQCSISYSRRYGNHRHGRNIKNILLSSRSIDDVWS